MTEQQAKGAPKGPGSFCVPRAAIEALLDAKATAYEICAYLVLAKGTDESGRYTPSSVHAVGRATGSNISRSAAYQGPVDRAIERLKQIRATRVDRVLKKVSNGRSGKAFAMVDQWVDEKADLGPILFERTAWQLQPGEVVPDGPGEKGKIRYVLPDFGEERASRVWFGNNLVGGVGKFDQPLKALKNAGDVAARLLLAMYAANDMDLWGGVRPIGAGAGPWKHYEPVDTDKTLRGGARLIRAKATDANEVGPGGMFSRAWPAPAKSASWWKEHDAAGGPVWRALEALKSAGMVYEVVMVLNKNAEKKKFSSGAEYSDIPDDAEPFYELDTRSEHGYKPDGEEGIGGATAKTAADFGCPVATEGGRFDGTYAAIVPKGYPAMIAGIYRLRFRPSNSKNAGVKGTWARIHKNNREAFELVQAIRAANNLPALVPPWEANKPQAAAPVDKVPF